MNYFELVSKYKDCPELLPTRATERSAGYDLYVAENCFVPSYNVLIQNMFSMFNRPVSIDLASLADITKTKGIRPTLVSTGVKCHLDDDKFLMLSLRSSTPLKYWLVLANSVGIIDSDYWNNSSNEGEIFLQVINFSPVGIELHKGDCIGQGIILPYYAVTGDEAGGTRTGGFGSTT